MATMRMVSAFVVCVSLAAPSPAALLIDDCEGGAMTNTRGGTWSTYGDGASSVTLTAEAAPDRGSSARCRRIRVSLAGVGMGKSYAGALASLNPGYTGEDLEAYHGFRFLVKGSGVLTLAVPIQATQGACGYDHFQRTISINSPSWELVEVPFQRLSQGGWGCKAAWNPAAVVGVQFGFSAGPGTRADLSIDDLEFYRKSEERSAPHTHFMSRRPKVNQIGYLPSQSKVFTVVTQTAGSGAFFEVKRASDGSAVHRGRISGSVISDPAAGEDLVSGDFSALAEPGEYVVEVNGQRSFPFRIGNGVYDGLFRDALRGYYIIRCGVALKDPETGLAHAACHTKDARFDDKAGNRDLTGGWHNAGDLGKWTHEHAFSVAYLLWLYELRTPAVRDVKIGIPESGNGVPDLLDQARWGLEFILKMQNPDGSVYNKVDTEPDFPFGTPTENDPFTRTAKPQGLGSRQFSTIPAATFCAATAQAARVFASVDPGFAKRCSAAARAAWTWLGSHPKTGQTDPYYFDAGYGDELLWATAEMARLTGDGSLASVFGDGLQARELVQPSWYDPLFFGCLTVHSDPRSSGPLKDKLREKVLRSAEAYRRKSEASGYRVSMEAGEYWWGSLTNALGRGNLFLLAHLMGGEKSYLDRALYQLDYVLGVNGLEQVFVTGFGAKRNENPFHWTKRVHGIALPGWPSGGPNNHGAGTGGAADLPLKDLISLGTPPQKCWLDLGASNGSWASNEGATDHLAALVFLTGYFLDNAPAP